MKRLYLTLAILGFALPYFFFIRFLAANRLDVRLLLQQLFANDNSTFFAVDLILTAVVFLLYSYAEAQRTGTKRWWVYLLATLLVGPSFTLPLFLYFRHSRVKEG